MSNYIKTLTKNCLSCFLLLLIFMPSIKCQIEFFSNVGFETGNLNGWISEQSGSSAGFHINDGTFAGVAGNNCFVNSSLKSQVNPIYFPGIGAPLQGSFDIINDQAGSGISSIRALVSVPDSIDYAVLSWDMR